MIRLFIISMMFWSCTGSAMHEAKKEAINYETTNYEQLSDSLLIGIQGKIMQAFVQSQMARSVNPINELSDDLAALYKTKPNNLIVYWQSYLKFYESIFYLSTADKKMAEKVCEESIKLLEKMQNKNAEDYVLLAMVQGFSIQFNPGMKAAFISKKVGTSLEAAMAIDSTNLRVNYVMANNDFYTPEQYGGGTKTEYYALKAISLPAQKVKNEYLPSWGKEEAYDILIKFYIKQEKWDLAKKYYTEACGAYPQSYLLGQLATQLVDK